ncbi:MAG: TrmH family RNA methyltransferase [Planctomycetaceae bacterium]
MHRPLFDYLETYLTETRKVRLREVLALRTRWLTVVLDDIYHPHNTSAALRSCDAFGLQDVHIVETQHDSQLSSDVAAGSDKWLTMERHQGPEAARDCVVMLRRRGFRIAATVLGPADATPQTLDLSQPVAVVIGNETSGVSNTLLDAADVRLSIPMYGFVDSFNLSVACALCLQDLSRRLRESDVDWELSDQEREELLFQWTRASISSVEAIEQRWRREQP